MFDEITIRNAKDGWFSHVPKDAYACTECGKPTDAEIEWVGDDGKGTGTYVCEACCEPELRGEPK